MNLESYVSEIKECYKIFGGSKHLFFRGHSKENYVLKPSVFRNIAYNEKDIVLDFKQYAPFHKINYNFIDDRDKLLANMQHYEIPTRLLDWTLAPLNALFFACKENESENGQVIILDPWKYWKKIVRDSTEKEIHQIHIISRALLSGGWNFDKVEKYISSKYGYSDLKVEDIDKPFAYISSYINNRILHQRGCFTIHGLCKTEMDAIPEAVDCIRRIDIDCSNKNTLMQEINYFYINHYSIFPDFEGMKEMIKRTGGLFDIKTI